MTLIPTDLAALILNITPRQVQRLVKEGELTNHSNNPRRIQLDLDDVSRLAQERTT